MALDGTYPGLKASVADWLNRADLTAAVPDFIALAEANIGRKFMKDGPVREMMGRSDATINAEFISVPADFLGANAIYLAPNYKPLEFITPDEVIYRKTLYPNTSGNPQAFSVVGSQFQFWPWVGSGAGTFTGELTYWKRIPALSIAAPANWLLISDPDIYLFGALSASAPYLKDDERLAVWGGLYTSAVADKISADKMARQAPRLSVGIVPGGTP